MKKIICIILSGLYFFPCIAQKINSDSLAYQLQRAKINQMLDERRQKFGQYDESLKMHTGIFGLQTKRDIRRSNDILMDIVKTDDNIFRELKILMDYRVYQQQQAQTHSNESENVTLAYMNTINRLRAQIDQLKQQMDKEKAHQLNILRVLIGIAVLMLASIFYLLSRKRKTKV
jgi:hypothetical protein